MVSLTNKTMLLPRRMRRNRKSESIRALVQETRLHPSNFVSPVFIVEGSNQTIPIKSMPGISRYSIDTLLQELETHLELGIRACNIFCYVPEEKKDPFGSEALRKENLLQRSISQIKQEFPELVVMADIALDPFTDHGHDGILNHTGYVINDETVDILVKMSLIAASAGADLVSPSDMMDGRVAAIRAALDANGFHQTGILSYAAKFASAFYGPFREALNSAPKIGNKLNYQLNPANTREALLEAFLDEEEGADMLLVKPALVNLDIIARLREQTNLPLAAYHVSGEYSMMKAAVDRGWMDWERVLMESLLSIKRAGADFIFTYGSKDAAEFLRKDIYN